MVDAVDLVDPVDPDKAAQAVIVVAVSHEGLVLVVPVVKKVVGAVVSRE